MGTVASEVHARMNEMASKLEAEDAEVSPEVGTGDASASEAVTESPITESPTAEATPAAPDPEAAEREKRHAILEEKLRYHRERAAKARAEARERDMATRLEQERKALEEEKATYEGLKRGSFKEVLQKLGRDPSKTFEEMQREAIEASTPEGKLRRELEALKQEVVSNVEPLKQQVQALIEERKALQEQIREQRYVAEVSTSMKEVLAAPEFEDLRVEYPEEVLLDHVRYYDKHPQELIAHARTFKVPLTAPSKGFTMHELLSVLSAAQAAHNAEVARRRGALRPAEPSNPANPTVNGTTAATRNAGNAIGNELAAGRAASKPDDSHLPVAERIRRRQEEEIRRLGG
jgi:hypothetical protein